SATIARFLYRGGSATIAHFLYRGGSAIIAHFLYRGGSGTTAHFLYHGNSTTIAQFIDQHLTTHSQTGSISTLYAGTEFCDNISRFFWRSHFPATTFTFITSMSGLR
ncbi:hypothetical protein G843_03124, partial [Escherichia coli HVH 191 (3-9341900)]